MKMELGRSVTAEEMSAIAGKLQTVAVQMDPPQAQSLEILEIGPCKLLIEDGMLKIKCEF